MIYKKESRIPWLKYFFQFTLPAFLVSLKTTAQNSKVPDTVQVQPIPKEEFLMGDTIAPVIIARTIEGIVKDKEGAPLHGVTVMIKGTSTGTATDATGNFKITVNDENEHTLVFSYVGYAPFELGKISAKKNKAVNVKLEPSTMDLLGVVIIAKSPKKKRSTLEKARSILTPDSVKLFPNPVFAGNDLNIELKVKEKGVHVISVTDFNGRAVLNTTVEAEDNTMKTSISTNQLLPGNYIVTVYNRWGKNIGTKKIIVQ